VYVGLNGSLLITSDANVEISSDSRVAVYQTLLYLLSLVGCQDQFCGVMYLWVTSACVLVMVGSSVAATIAGGSGVDAGRNMLLIGLKRHIMRIHNMLGRQWWCVPHRQA
jgi:hypothetical protein